MSSPDGFEMLKNWQRVATELLGSSSDENAHIFDVPCRVAFVGSSLLRLVRLDSGAAVGFDLTCSLFEMGELAGASWLVIKLQDGRSLTLREDDSEPAG